MSAPQSVARLRGARAGHTTAVITSLSNPRIKWIRSLRTRKERERSRLFYVESLRLVKEATEQKAEIHMLVVAPEAPVSLLGQEVVGALKGRGVPRLEVTPDVFDSLAVREGAPRIGAVVCQRWELLERVRPSGDLCWVVLDSVQYPGNLGTILRTGDAVGGAGAILLGHATDPYDPAAVRASLGAVFSQRLVRTSFAEFAAWARRHGCMVVGTSPAASTDYREVAYRPPVALFMGSERYGLPPEHQAACDVMVRIPMVGRCDSLNLAIATSIVLYEIFDRRRSAVYVVAEPERRLHRV
jgi:TrmH family RNA methyltransferase